MNVAESVAKLNAGESVYISTRMLSDFMQELETHNIVCNIHVEVNRSLTKLSLSSYDHNPARPAKEG